MEMFVSIVMIILMIAAAVLMVDYFLFNRRMSMVKKGMTGNDVQNSTTLKIRNIVVDGEYFYAKVYSKTTLFARILIFKDGRYVDSRKA